MDSTAPPLRTALFAVAALAYLAGTALAAWAVIAACDGRLISWLDDAYIHMAMARNLLEHGVYGVTPHGFTTSSSSPAWVILLSVGYALLGVSEWLPFAVNAVATLVLLFCAASILTRPADTIAGGELGPRWRMIDAPWPAACAVVGMVALVATVAPITLTLAAMEHVAHAALMLYATDILARRLCGEEAEEMPTGASVHLPLLLLPLVRYESLWLPVIAAALAIGRRQWFAAIAMPAAASVGVVAVGAWSCDAGWWFLPVSILAKTSLVPGAAADGGALYVAKFLLWYPFKRLLLNAPILLAIMAMSATTLAVAVARDRDNARTAWFLALAMFVGGAWTHATFRQFGWGGRYEGYLLAMGCVFLPAALARLRPDVRAFRSRPALMAGLPLLALLTGLVVHRTVVMHRGPGAAAATVWQRDFWPADFVAQHFGGGSVMAMNIGALSWISSPRLTDVLALGDREVAGLLAAGRLDNAALIDLARRRGVTVAILFDADYRRWVGAPPPFVRVATGRPQAAPENAFAFYATTPERAAELARALQTYVGERTTRVTLTVEPAWSTRR